MVQPLSETVWRLLRKLKTELPCDPAILLLGIYMDKTIIQKDTCIPMFIATLFTRAKKHRNNLAMCSNMNTARDYSTKRSEPEREGQIPYDITYMWNLKYGTNEPVYKTETGASTVVSVAKTLSSQCRWPSFNPWSGN